MRPRTRHAYPILLILGISLGFLGLAACGSGPKPSPEPVAVQPPPAKPDLSALIGAKDAAGIKDFFKNRELLDTPDSEGYYPLHRAVLQDASDIVELLTGLGARLEATDAKGRTPLRLAADEGKAGPAKILAARGASIFAQDKTGSTAAAAALARGGAVFDAVFSDKTVNQKA